MRQGSGARLRSWGLVQAPGEQVRSGPLEMDWRGRLQVRRPGRRLGRGSRGRGQGLSLGRSRGRKRAERVRGQEGQGWVLALGMWGGRWSEEKVVSQ